MGERGQQEEEQFFIPFGDHHIFAREVEGADAGSDVVAIVVHGGPGLSDHTESLPGLRHLRGVAKILFFDQLGCGKSDTPEEDTSLYMLQGHIQQLQQVIDYCRKERYSTNTKLCVLGHSWGGQILLELLLLGSNRKKEKESPIDYAIVSNAPLDEQTYQKHQQALRHALDPDIRAFYEEQDVLAAQDLAMGARIFQTLIGTSETNITGELKHWSVLDRISHLLVASTTHCLFLVTKDDTVPFQEYQTIQHQLDEIAPHHHQVMIMEQGGHGPFFGATAKEYFDTIERFLSHAASLV